MPSVRSKGFTLIEVMVVVVIIGILATIAYPAYQKFTVQSRRTDGQIPLARLAAAQEKFYSECGHYARNIVSTSTAQACGTSAASFANGNLPFNTTTEKTLYTISLVTPTVACPITNCYRLQAAPDSGKSQASDGTLTIDSQGNRLRTVGIYNYKWSDK